MNSRPWLRLAPFGAIRALLCRAAGAASPTIATQTPPKTPADPAFYAWAATPPMGWNSYDAFGDMVTEAQVLQNAQYMTDNLICIGLPLRRD